MSDNHGNTVAAWSAVGIAILAFVVAGIGLMAYSWLTFWIGAVILVLAPVVGTILARMGYGATH
jgi:multisubunit Na+/H+ antiporter MnhG subunit